MIYTHMVEKQQNMVQKVCFTLNNYTPAEYASILDCGRNKCKFMVVGKETGENGTPHLQGYANFVKRTRFTALKKFLPRAHFEKAQGTDEQNLTYCTKQDKEAFVFGTPQSSGKRNDLTAPCKAIVEEKKTVAQVAQEYPEQFVKYSRGLERLSSYTKKPRDVNDPPTVLWVWGKSGVGKTRLAYDQLPHDQIYMKDGTQWWDGYTQQLCILVDDFDGKWPYRDFLRFTDRYPYQGQVKGGYVHVNSPLIIITCEHPPGHFWVEDQLTQVMRRMTLVNELT